VMRLFKEPGQTGGRADSGQAFAVDRCRFVRF
jgi:hypothetical protein